MILSKNQRFIQEYTEFSEKISKISNEQVKAECVKLLKELARHVQDLDKKHMEFGAAAQMPTHMGDARESIQTIRKKLSTYLK